MLPKTFILPILLLGMGCICLACATPQPTWQPRSAEPAIAIHVYRTAIHTIVSLPSDAPAQHAAPLHEINDWSYGQKFWFYDTRSTGAARLRMHLRNGWFYTTGFFAAIFWPSAGVVEIDRSLIPMPEREPEDVRHMWTFYISPAELQAMRSWLWASVAPDEEPIYTDSESAFFVSQRRYWMFYNCHHYAAGALRAAGIPVSGWRGEIPTLFWRQLGTLEKLQAPPVIH